MQQIKNTRQYCSLETYESSQEHPGTLDLRSNGLVLRSHGYTTNNMHKILKRNETQPYDEDQRIEKEKGETKWTSPVQGNQTGSRTNIKRHGSPVFSLSPSLSLSKETNQKRRERSSPLSLKIVRPKKKKRGFRRGGRPVSGGGATASECQTYFFNFFFTNLFFSLSSFLFCKKKSKTGGGFWLDLGLNFRNFWNQNFTKPKV